MVLVLGPPCLVLFLVGYFADDALSLVYRLWGSR